MRALNGTRFVMATVVILGSAFIGIAVFNKEPTNRVEVTNLKNSTVSPEQFITEGELLVRDISDYRSEYGHWPVSLIQVASHCPTTEWSYSFQPDHPIRPEWRLTRASNLSHNSILFTFNIENRCGEWQLRWDGFTKQPQSNVVLPDRKIGAKRNGREIIAKLQKDRKVDPDHNLLYIKIILHFRLEAGDFATAIPECTDALIHYPDDVWLSSCLTSALVGDGYATKSDMPLPVERRAFVTGRITDYIYAACICHELGLTSRAKNLLEQKFSNERFRSLSSEPPGVQDDCWCASVLAIRLKDYELLGRVVDAWSINYGATGYGDISFRAFRAFANLKKGRHGEARREMRELGIHLHSHTIRARNIDALTEAIEMGNTAFEFDPGPFPSLGSCILQVK
jgi:hypothetical protein